MACSVNIDITELYFPLRKNDAKGSYMSLIFVINNAFGIHKLLP